MSGDLMDVDEAAEKLKPFAAAVLNQMVIEHGERAVRALMPLKVRIVLTMSSGDTKVAQATAESMLVGIEKAPTH
jgi:hypothetical protein